MELSCIVSYGIASSVILYVLAFFYNKWTRGVCKSDTVLNGKVVIVTGANAGIGYEVALDMAARKAHLIMACRSLERGNAASARVIEQTGNKNVEVMQLDLSSLESVRKFAADFQKKNDRLDILINNAGFVASKFTKSVDGYETTFATNHLGPFLLTNLLLDLIKKTKGSRIVNTASEASRMCSQIDFENLNLEKYSSTLDLNGAYNRSKLMNVLFTRELSNKLEGTGVTTNSLHPGVVASEFFNNATWVNKPFVWLGKPFFKTSKEGAQTTIYLAVSQDVENVSGKYFSDCKEVAPASNALDDGVAKKLWEVSESLCGI